jgi:hypothetical protein
MMSDEMEALTNVKTGDQLRVSPTGEVPSWCPSQRMNGF